MTGRKFGAAMIALAFAVSAQAQDKDDARVVGDIASQPARDVGIAKTSTPAVLQRALDNPYAPLKSCTQIASAIRALNEPLGPDFGSGAVNKRAGIGERGGRAVVNSLIPFRGVVREVSGAAGAERRREQAVSAGYARRGYLRGLQSARGCRR